MNVLLFTIWEIVFVLINIKLDWENREIGVIIDERKFNRVIFIGFFMFPTQCHFRYYGWTMAMHPSIIWNIESFIFLR